MMRIFTVLFCAVLLGMSACTKVPDKIQSPSLKIDVDYRDGVEVFPVRISAGLANDNNGRSLGNIRGSVSIIDPVKGKTVMSFPYIIDMVLPFATGIIDAEKTCTLDEIGPLAKVFDIDINEMIKNRGTDTLYIDDEKISFTIDSYEKHNILTLLEGKLHEKN